MHQARCCGLFFVVVAASVAIKTVATQCMTYALPPHAFQADEGGILEAALLEAANYPSPAYIGTIEFPHEEYESLLAEGRARAAANAARQGARYVNTQAIPNCPFTSDELGRLCEGAVHKLLPLEAAAVVPGTDARPDMNLWGTSFDIKSAYARPGNTFSVSHYRAKKYDALMLVQLTASNELRVWACKCEPDAAGWELRRGQPDFYLLKCPDTGYLVH